MTNPTDVSACYSSLGDVLNMWNGSGGWSQEIAVLHAASAYVEDQPDWILVVVDRIINKVIARLTANSATATAKLEAEMARDICLAYHRKLTW